MKTLSKIGLLLMVLFPFLWMAPPASSETADEVNIILHKLVFPENKLPEESENTGEERLKEYAGLNDVTFEVYDVTTDFYRLLDETNNDIEKVLAKLQGMDVSGHPVLMQKTTAPEKGEDGIATFTLPSKSMVGAVTQDAIYLFRESKAPANVKRKAADMIVSLPIIDEKSKQEKKTIHLYPKNELSQPTFEKEIVDQADSYQYGDQIRYRLTTKIPESLTGYSFYRISDQAASGLLLEGDSLNVSIEGNVFDGYQKTEISDHGFNLLFDVGKLSAYTGKKLTVEYTMRLDKTKTNDFEWLNRAELETDHDKIVKEKKVRTGGKKFIKVETANEKKVLADAEFLVKNTEGAYLHEDEKSYHWYREIRPDSIVKLLSNPSGTFEIQGLRYGNYLLEEVKAPQGYVLSKKDVAFEIKENSYSMSNGVLKIVNQKNTTTTSQSKKTNQTIGTKQAAKGGASDTSQRSKSYPKTNDLKNPWLIVTGGAILILVSFIIAFQRKHRKGE